MVHKALSAGKFLENYNFNSWMRRVDWRIDFFQCVTDQACEWPRSPP